MNSDLSLYVGDQQPDSLDVDHLSIALIGPDNDSRRAAAIVLAGCKGSEIHEFPFYPPNLDAVPAFLEQHYDVIIIGLDAQPEYALQLVECMCVSGTTTVMVYSAKTDSEVLVRCMRAGAREFLTFPFTQDNVVKALIRASTRRPGPRVPRKANGRLLAFLGAKGGDGVTTLACNFAVSLAQESSQSTLLIDLDLPLGDAALNLGISAQYSTISALENASRLDSSFLSQLLVKHSSGVSVLAAPGKFPQFDASIEAIDKLIAVARQDFDNVVIDMGSRLDLTGTSIFKEGSTVYLVIQAGVAGLRNSNRLISQYFSTGVPKLEIVLNRFQHRSMGLSEDQITKVLTRPAQWKIPNDFAAVRRMQHTAIPLALEDSHISRVIRQIARSACGLPPILEKEKKTGFSLKNISRNLTAKISSSEEEPTVTKLGLAGDTEGVAAAVGDALSKVTASTRENPAATPAAENAPSAEMPKPSTQADTVNTAGNAAQNVSALVKVEEPETRTFRGATYVKGADGKWHLQQGTAKAVVKVPERKTPVIEWQAPGSISFGTALGPRQLNAVASVPGAFAYTPGVGEILAAGMHSLKAVFTPADNSAYTAAEAKVVLTVTRAKPAVVWSAPASVVYGTPLSAAQLNATASVPGTFVYAPAAGEVLTAGTQALSATFTPADSTDYAPVNAIVPLTVTKAESAITWPAPASIAYGTALSAAQLNAAASVPGTFIYTPAAGEVLAAGLQTLSVIFTPSDGTNYNKVRATVPLTVTRATPIITWPAPEAIPFGTALSAAQLNASASVPGAFSYSPAAGEVLQAGKHALSVRFTPADMTGYSAVQVEVSLTVTEAKPVTASRNAAPSSHDAAFGAGQFTVKAQPVAAEAAPAEDGKAAVQAPVSTQPSAKPVSAPPVNAPQEPPAKAAAKPHVKPAAKVRTNPPAEPVTEVSAALPVEPPAKSIVRVPGSNSVIDVGPGLNLMGSAVFQDGTTIYLVMQPGSGGQQNSSRLVSQFFTNRGPKPEIVINRSDPGTQGVAEGQTSTALTRKAYSPISRLIGQMAQPASDQPATQEKETGFSLKSLGRKFWSKISASEKEQSITKLGLANDGGQESSSGHVTQPGSAANFPDRPVYAAPAAPVFLAGMPIPHRPGDTAGHAEVIGGKLEGSQSGNTSSMSGGPETRTYKGANYVRGADGQWHLQKSQTSLRETGMEAQAVAHFYEPVPAAEAAPETVPEKASVRRAAKAAAKPAAKAPAKRITKAAAKPVAKNSAKKAVKSTAKSTTQKTAGRNAKTATKAPAEASAKRVAKNAAKPAAKNSAKQLVKAKTAAAKPAAKSPARKAIAKKKSAPASSPVPNKAAKLSTPVLHTSSDRPVAEFAVSALTPELTVQMPDSEIPVTTPVSESAGES